jgi:hypothetical protein
MFNAAKDALTGRAVQTYANNLLSRYAKIRDLKINSGQKTMVLTCELHGETEPVTINVDRYELREENGQRFVEITACRGSREWINNVLADFVRGKKVPLPAWAAAAL